MVGSLIASTFAALTTVTAVGATVLTTAGMAVAAAINFAVSAIVSRVFAPNIDTNQNVNSREQIPPSADNTIPVVYGDAYLGGTFIDAALSIDQTTMFYVMAISSISPNGQFTYDKTKFYYGGRLITFDTVDLAAVASLTDEAGNVDTSVFGRMAIYLYTSNSAGVITAIGNPSTPQQVMNAVDLAPQFVWAATGRQMFNTAFAIVKLRYGATQGVTSLQPITFKVKHALYGTGVAKPGDVWYDYMTSATYGAAVDATYVNSAARTALNTYSDQTIAFTPVGGGSSSQARYRINGVLTGNISVLDNIDKILVACDSWMTYSAAAGQWSVVINKAESASFAFNDSNIVGDIRVSATDITQSVNQIEARFPFKENKDQSNFVVLALQTLNPALLYPNEPVNKTSITYDLVNDSVQAQYLANRVLEQAREDLIVSFNTTYYGIQVDAGDVISLTNTDYGWSSKLFRVMKVNEVSLPDGGLGARLEMSEYSAAVYDDNNITQYQPVPNSGISAPQNFGTLGTPVVLASFPNAAVPSFDVRVTVPTVGSVTYITLYYTTTPTPGPADWYLLSTASLTTEDNFTPGSNYDFIGQILPGSTYYFSYTVGNNLGVSTKSAQSAAFVWGPIAPTGPTGPSGTQAATAYLYQWSTAQPGNPSGQSTYTWGTGTNGSYTGGNGWMISIPANPGTPGILLWAASKQVVASAGATTTVVSWTSGFSVYASSGNGNDGIKTVTAIVYRWATTIPTISGTSTYTWATDSISPLPTNWFGTISDTGSAGQTLWAAEVVLKEPVTALTSTINWSTSSILPFGYSGLTGAVARVAYTAATVTLNTTPQTFTVVGDVVPATGSWGTGQVWSYDVPVLSAGQSVWQSDGIYNPTNNQTIWGLPYLAALKVGNLSAISTNTGSLTVSGNVKIGAYGAILGGQTDFNTGTGFFLGYSGGAYKFSIGNATTNLTWSGTAFTVTGGVIQTGTSGSRLIMGGPSYSHGLMGYNTSGTLTMGFNASVGQVYASNYTNGIAGDFDNTSSTVAALRGINSSAGNGVGIEGRSSNYFGAAVYGGTASAPFYINATGALPTKGAINGALCVYNNKLWFHNGTAWKEVSLI